MHGYLAENVRQLPFARLKKNDYIIKRTFLTDAYRQIHERAKNKKPLIGMSTRYFSIPFSTAFFALLSFLCVR